MEKKKYKVTHDMIYAFRNGDDEAFNKIYKHYFTQVYFFAFTHVNNAELAKDIAQNTMIVVYKSIKSLQHVEAFHVWVMRIAYNECHSIFRKNKNKQTVELPDYADIETVEAKQVSMPDHIEDVVLYDTIYNSIQNMSGKLKDVAVLRYLDGLSEEEIAKILRIPKGTVKSRNHRIKNILKDTLKRNDITPMTYKMNYSTSIPTIITAALAYASMQNQPVIPNYQTIIRLAPTISATTLGGLSFLTTKFVVGAVATTSILVGAGYVATQKTEATEELSMQINKGIMSAPEKREIVEEPGKISNIQYNTNYTNDGVDIKVDTTNMNYDRILVNDEEVTRITENGTYVVKVIKDHQVIDERVIQINNIDRTSPKYLNHLVEESVYTVYLEDDISGINQKSIKYIKNDIESTDYIYNAKEKTITFLFESKSSNEFDVYDNAGNYVNISFVSEYK